ncbi:MAG: hypothetical protein R3E08_04160 [Thiotrichaceae bacterium]
MLLAAGWAGEIGIDHFMRWRTVEYGFSQTVDDVQVGQSGGICTVQRKLQYGQAVIV